MTRSQPTRVGGGRPKALGGPVPWPSLAVTIVRGIAVLSRLAFSTNGDARRYSPSTPLNEAFDALFGQLEGLEYEYATALRHEITLRHLGGYLSACVNTGRNLTPFQRLNPDPPRPRADRAAWSFGQRRQLLGFTA